jgi:hypothetical protein
MGSPELLDRDAGQQARLVWRGDVVGSTRLGSPLRQPHHAKLELSDETPRFDRASSAQRELTCPGERLRRLGDVRVDPLRRHG